MRVVQSFPRSVREIETVWIPLTDGRRLAARIWLPEDAERSPVPAILQHMPYRRRDFTAARDEVMHRYFAGHGYAAVRVDIGGSGDSEGLLADEYLPQELDEGRQVIGWLAQQPWCSGTVGMIGNSWSGFNALQVAALQPPALKAIITSCSTDDRYADDMHYMGGCLLNDMFDWGTVFFSHLPKPPDPAVVGGPGWREIWFERMRAAGLPIEPWLRHQRRDAFWKHGSVCEDFSRIRCAVFAVGGWVDGYSNAIPRLLENLTVPRLGLIGPWAHAFPHVGSPGPAINFLQEALRFWDHWLKGADTGIMDEPMLRVFMQEAVPAKAYYAVCPGRWVAERSWPSPGVEVRQWYLGEHRLQDGPGEDTVLSVCTPQLTGLAGGEWCPGGTGGGGPEYAEDQREDDGRSLCFETGPLAERLEILGAPVADLELAVDRRCAFLAVRLCDVAPDGASTRATYGILNLTHRDSHERPEPLEPGRRYRVRVKLNDTAYAFLPGHRIRLAVSTTYWPLVWPSPEPVTLSLQLAGSRLELPVRPVPAEEPEIDLGEPEGAPPPATAWLREGSAERRVEKDVPTGTVCVTNVIDGGLLRLDATGNLAGSKKVERAWITEGDPLSATTEVTFTVDMGREDHPVHFDCKTRLTASRDTFFLEGTWDAFERGKRVFSKVVNAEIPRDLM